MRLVLALILALATVAGAQVSLPRHAPVPLASFTPITVLPMSTRNAGTYSFGPVTIPTGVSGGAATMDVSQATDPLPVITVILEGSVDGGTTWRSAGSWSRPSNPKGTRPPPMGGGPVTAIEGRFWGGPFWDDTTNANRRLRGVATISTSMRLGLVVTPQ